MPSNPTPMQWLPPGEGDDIRDAGSIEAYEWPDYPGERAGNGVYTDLFWDADLTAPAGRLWTGGGAAGVVHVADEFSGLYALAALKLRRCYHDGLQALDGFNAVATDFHTGPIFEGPLDHIADPAIEANASI